MLLLIVGTCSLFFRCEFDVGLLGFIIFFVCLRILVLLLLKLVIRRFGTHFQSRFVVEVLRLPVSEW